MTRIARLVLVDLLLVFVLTLVGMTGLMLLFGVVGEAVKHGLGAGTVLRMLPYVVPGALVYAIPASILFATCSVYGRLAANNEVVAVKSLGISPVRLLYPGFGLAFVVSVGSVWVIDLAGYWGTRGVQRVILQSLEEIAYGMLQTQRMYSPAPMPELTIHVQRVEGKRLIRPTIAIHGADGRPKATVFAQEAELRYNPERDVLTVYLSQAEVFGELDQPVHAVFPTLERDIPLGLGAEEDVSAQRPATMASRLIAEETERQRGAIVALERDAAADAGFLLTSGGLGELTGPSWEEREQALRQARSRLLRLQTEPWRRWASGFSCLCFVLVGAPLAMQLRNADVFTTFGRCFLPILCIYYPLFMAGFDGAKAGRLPPYSVWLGNLVLAMVGAWLVRRVRRY